LTFVGSGITPEQLYTTASYQARDLTGINFIGNDLAGANFARQNLTNTRFYHATLTDADFTDANLSNASLAGGYYLVTGPDLTNADFSRANLTNAVFYRATLTNANFTAADMRGPYIIDFPASAITSNLIRHEGNIDGLDLYADALLIIRDYDGDSRQDPAYPPIPITVNEHLTMAPGGTLRMVFEADAWDSTISVAPGIPVTLGGTLELTFGDEVNLASQLGRTFDLFNWTGVAPTGTFAIASPYQWDTSHLYTTGEVSLTAVPEPATLVVLYTLMIATLFRYPRVTRQPVSPDGNRCGLSVRRRQGQVSLTPLTNTFLGCLHESLRGSSQN
jgi:uncharacterized protein YjbI with pentapeptide repeats